MRTTTAVIIGAGHAGLAMSRRLTERSIDHVVLERGEVANSWRTERWDSLRLLTPNWQSRLPGHAYDGTDPDGFRTMPEVVGFIERYAPTDRGSGRNRHDGDLRPAHRRRLSGGHRPGRLAMRRRVVLASGACNVASVPTLAEAVPASITMLTPHQYRKPDQLPTAACWSSARRPRACSSPTRSSAPAGRSPSPAASTSASPGRTGAATSIWWMDAAGVLDQRYDEVDDIARARRLPSFQLVGSPERAPSTSTRCSASASSSSAALAGNRRWPAAVLRLAAQHLRAGRSENGSPARHLRRVGDACGHGRRGRAAAPVRADRGGRARRDSSLDLARGEIAHDRLGDRLSARLFLAGRAGARSQGHDPP